MGIKDYYYSHRKSLIFFMIKKENIFHQRYLKLPSLIIINHEDGYLVEGLVNVISIVFA